MQQQNFEFLGPNDPIYTTLQNLFYKQLISLLAGLQVQQQELNAKRKQIQSHREEIGVQLYNAQHQLAASQMDYEKAHNNFNHSQMLRIQSQQKLTQINQIYSSKKEQLSILEGQATTAQKQLQNSMKHYHQIESQNAQLKSDIAVTKIQMFTAKENVTILEKIKKKPDQLTDQMNLESKRLQEQKNMLAVQIISQKEKTSQMKKILRETQAQMQKVRKQQQKIEKLAEQSACITNQKNLLEIQRKNLMELQSKISSQHQLLKQALQTNTDQISRTQTQTKQVESSMNLIQTNIMKPQTQTKRLLQELINKKSKNTMIQKTASNMKNQVHQLQFQTVQKQIQYENLTNQTSRVKSNQLNIKSQIELLYAKKNKLKMNKIKKNIQILDPNVNQSEIEQLKKQLHRMQLKYSSLIKQQQQNSTEMRRTVNNKDTIMLEQQASLNIQKQPQANTQLAKAIVLAKQNIGKVIKSLQQAEHKLAQRKQQLDNIDRALQQQINQYRYLEAGSHQLQAQTVMSKIRRIANVLQIAILQNKYRKLDEISTQIQYDISYKQI